MCTHLGVPPPLAAIGHAGRAKPPGPRSSRASGEPRPDASDASGRPLSRAVHSRQTFGSEAARQLVERQRTVRVEALKDRRKISRACIGLGDDRSLRSRPIVGRRSAASKTADLDAASFRSSERGLGREEIIPASNSATLAI